MKSYGEKTVLLPAALIKYIYERNYFIRKSYREHCTQGGKTDLPNRQYPKSLGELFDVDIPLRERDRDIPRLELIYDLVV
jgi:hypothetical protein